MKTITTRLTNEEDAELLKSILKSTHFQDFIETTEKEEDMLTDEDLTVLNERLEMYRINPASGNIMNEVNQILKKKYGV